MNKFKKILSFLSTIPLPLVTFVSCQSSSYVKSNVFQNIIISRQSMYAESIEKKVAKVNTVKIT